MILNDASKVLQGTADPDQLMRQINKLINDDPTGEIKKIVANIFRQGGCNTPYLTLDFLQAATN